MIHTLLAREERAAGVCERAAALKGRCCGCGCCGGVATAGDGDGEDDVANCT